MLYFIMKPIHHPYGQVTYIRHGRPIKSKKRAINSCEKLEDGAHVMDDARRTVFVKGSQHNHHHV